MLCAFEGKCDHCGHDHGNPFDRMQNFTEQADRITSLESHNRELLAVNQVLREALQQIIDMEGTENDEWDAVERIIPKIARIAKVALQTKSNTE